MLRLSHPADGQVVPGQLVDRPNEFLRTPADRGQACAFHQRRTGPPVAGDRIEDHQRAFGGQRLEVRHAATVGDDQIRRGHEIRHVVDVPERHQRVLRRSKRAQALTKASVSPAHDDRL